MSCRGEKLGEWRLLVQASRLQCRVKGGLGCVSMKDLKALNDARILGVGMVKLEYTDEIKLREDVGDLITEFNAACGSFLKKRHDYKTTRLKKK